MPSAIRARITIRPDDLLLSGVLHLLHQTPVGEHGAIIRRILASGLPFPMRGADAEPLPAISIRFTLSARDAWLGEMHEQLLALKTSGQRNHLIKARLHHIHTPVILSHAQSSPPSDVPLTAPMSVDQHRVRRKTSIASKSTNTALKHENHRKPVASQAPLIPLSSTTIPALTPAAAPAIAAPMPAIPAASAPIEPAAPAAAPSILTDNSNTVASEIAASKDAAFKRRMRDAARMLDFS